MARPFTEEFKQKWKENILEQRKSDFSIASWCRQNGVASHSFYYWENKLFPKDLSRSTFVEVVEGKKRSASGVFIEYQEFNIHLLPNFDSSLLKQCLKVLKEC